MLSRQEIGQRRYISNRGRRGREKKRGGEGGFVKRADDKRVEERDNTEKISSV